MKSVSLFTAALLVAGVANAQSPTNTFKGTAPYAAATPMNPNKANDEVAGAAKGGWSHDYNDYSQDSYVSQVGNGNSATVDQSDSRKAMDGGGSTAILNQNGDKNTATQKQTLKTTDGSNDYKNGLGRNLVKATQNGMNSQSNQVQNGGGYNTAVVLQGAGTMGNRAIQTQNLGDGNQATIKQTFYATEGSGSGNYAEQTQSGGVQVAKIDQESNSSYAKQTQSAGNNNDAYIHQGDPGQGNTAMQVQSGQYNVARIKQSVSSTADNNYAEQGQSGFRNQADIEQKSSSNYAEQQQKGNYNYARTVQENVSSASYTTQNGMNNTAIVRQH